MPTKTSESTRAKALAALDGMREIVRAEMLVQDSYVEPDISNPRRMNSICGGRRHCAVGALWAGYGVQMRHWTLPGVRQYEREFYMRHRPGLRLAYDALNQAAETFAASEGISRPLRFPAAIEDLFEGSYLGKRELLTVIAAAKRAIRRAR